jgi:hypothetical protein
MQEPPGGEWVSIPEAATRLHLVPDTVRRRIKRGQLIGRKASRPYGFVYEVYLESSGPGLDGDQTEAAPSRPALDGERDAVILRLAESNTQLAARVGWLEAQLQTARERIALLESPPAVETPERAPGRPWWRIWRWAARPA